MATPATLLGKGSPGVFHDLQGMCTGLGEGLCCRLLPGELLLAQVGPRKTSCCVPLASTLMAIPSSQEHLTGLNLFLGLHQCLALFKLRTSSCSYYPLHCRQVQLSYPGAQQTSFPSISTIQRGDCHTGVSLSSLCSDRGAPRWACGLGFNQKEALL